MTREGFRGGSTEDGGGPRRRQSASGRWVSRVSQALSTAAIILACSASAAGAQNPPPLVKAGDLLPLTSQSMVQGIPIMLVFTHDECPFCTRAKKEHLEPMAVSTDYGPKVIIREVDVESTAEMRDFEGKPVTQREFARRYNIRSVPTVITFTSSGQTVSEPLVGLLTPDFYNLYLHRQIDDGRLFIRRAAQPR
ncbi:MAG: thioredoxin family protein [Burkholderiales bacterium]